MCDLSTGQLRQLTDDAFADLQPAWSHDGRTIAFVTERYSSDLDALRFGRPRLALMDLESQAVREVPIAAANAQLNPQWSARRSRFVFRRRSRRDDEHLPGRSADSRALRRLTNVETGVSGVTPTSPAFSVAEGAPALAFTVYERGRPRLVVIKDCSVLEGEKVATAIVEADDTDGLPIEGAVDLYWPI